MVDPTGKDGCNVFNTTYEGSGNFPCYDASTPSVGNPYQVESSGGGLANTGSSLGTRSPDLAAGEAAYTSNFGWQATGLLYGKSYNQFFSSLDAYFGWRTGIAALPESKAYNAYMMDCAHSATTCTGGETITTRYQGWAGNYALGGSALNAASVAGMIPDPAITSKFMHGGPSWYDWSLIDTGHVATNQSREVESHQDSFSPIFLAPLHALVDVFPSLFINPRPGAAGPIYTCSPVGGCY